MRRQAVAMLLGLALGLAACSNQVKDGAGVGKALIASVKQVTLRKRAGGPVQSPVTRAEIDKYDMALLRTTITSRGFDALLTIRDARDGIVTWETSDGVTFTLRNGILIETRGLGADLMSSKAPIPAQLLQVGVAYERSYFFVGPDDKIETRSYSCLTQSLGVEEIDLVGESRMAQHLTENCQRAGGKLTSEYWLEGQTVSKSRQWVSPRIGYIAFEHVKD